MKKVPVPLLDLVQTVIKIKQISFPVNIFQLDSPFNFTGCPQTVPFWVPKWNYNTNRNTIKENPLLYA